ncbi:elongation factor 1-gamma [Condylostylus longicornis]|uniref:elongation factor 1-gamma n=1 Tax=Condylostylus longicornis TaxID=2530218 RepID=UPI00244E4182|nr:elongation factor 1-gamma [Condylostylus longicornis]
MAGTLYTYDENFRAYKALIAAQFSGAKVNVAKDFVFGETNKTAAYLQKFPTGKVPAFETADGKYLLESNAIAFYLANTQLRGTNDFQQAEIQQWISFADNEILPASCAWVFPLLSIMQNNKQVIQNAKEDITAALEILNKRLIHNTFLVGERITLADIIVFCNLIHLYQYVLEPSLRAPYGSVTRWFTTILNQPQVKAVVKPFELCTKTLEFDAKKYSEFLARPSGKQKDEKKQQGKQEKKKETKPAEESTAVAEEEEAAPAVQGFDFETFKRVYSNEDESKSIPYFWDKFNENAGDCSIWFGEYKYNDELTKVFMSCNLITGMFQRLDKMRKYSFASVCLFGEDNNSSISGIWIWRGQDLMFTQSPDWQIDYDCYEWKKLDPASEETKKLVQQYLSWTGEDKKGRKFNQGKIFK